MISACTRGKVSQVAAGLLPVQLESVFDNLCQPQQAGHWPGLTRLRKPVQFGSRQVPSQPQPHLLFMLNVAPIHQPNYFRGQTGRFWGNALIENTSLKGRISLFHPSLIASTAPSNFPNSPSRAHQPLPLLCNQNSVNSTNSPSAIMSDQIQEILEVPSEFTRSGIQFIKRCTKRTSRPQRDTCAPRNTDC
jgi:hypothetical protein